MNVYRYLLRFLTLVVPLGVLIGPLLTKATKLRHHKSNAHRRKRHKQHLQFSETDVCLGKRFPTVCQVPGISDAQFAACCTAYYQKEYVCEQPFSNLLSDADLSCLEGRILAGKFSYCRYDNIKRETFQYPLGDSNLVRKFYHKKMKDVTEAEHRRKYGIQGHPPGTKDHQIFPRLRHLERRLNLGITLMEKYTHMSIKKDPLHTLDGDDFKENFLHQASSNCNLNVTVPAGVAVRGTKQKKEFLYQYYSNVTRNKWSYQECITDVSILILGRTKDDYELDTKQFFVSFSDRSQQWLGPIAMEKVNKLLKSLREQNELQPIQQLKYFFDGFVPIMDKYFDPEYTPHQHTIPRWAWYAFGASIGISCLASVVGNFVTTDLKKRSSSTGAKKPSKKWGAGFSGGMWSK